MWPEWIYRKQVVILYDTECKQRKCEKKWAKKEICEPNWMKLRSFFYSLMSIKCYTETEWNEAESVIAFIENNKKNISRIGLPNKF